MYNSIILGKTALLGIQNAADWYSGQSQKACDNFLDAIDARLLDLKNRPESFPVLRLRPNYGKVKLRRFPYFLIFKIYPSKKQVFIALIVHEKRDMGSWIKQLR